MWLPDSVFTTTTEHCLVGIKGTVRRNYDGNIIHANVDTDVMLSEEPPYGATDKPSELYAIIEHFCQVRLALTHPSDSPSCAAQPGRQAATSFSPTGPLPSTPFRISHHVCPLSTLHPAPCTLHSAPCILHVAPCALHEVSCTQHPATERYSPPLAAGSASPRALW